ncbi:GNAT family N-acetyltransferase [Streptomyces chartreusis]|uniref:GNAT family N-acetyltransferase n=1 Tax=Streptomyces chartreusis TaxID=1969 RepID=UPI0035E09A9C
MTDNKTCGSDPPSPDPSTNDALAPHAEGVHPGASANAAEMREANAAAQAVAHASGILLKELHELGELGEVYALFDRVWRPDPTRPPITREFLRVLALTGNYVVGAYRHGELVGAAVGLLGAPVGRTLHSHLVAVDPSARGQHIGLALKLHQRASAIKRGIEAITWTFDPLQRRNAAFNITRLGARVVEYLPNFYGPLDDGINGTDDSDRLLVCWPVGLSALPDTESIAERDCVIALDRGDDGGPKIGDTDARLLLAAVPLDIEALRGHSPAMAGAWRKALREVLGGLLAEGAHVSGFDRAGWYLIERTGQ